MILHILPILRRAADPVEDLAHQQTKRLAAGRTGPRHEADAAPGGGRRPADERFWVISGFIPARQCIVGLREVRGADGILRCGIELDPGLVPTEPVPRRPFQGWRYLPESDAPRDLDPNAPKLDRGMPSAMRAALTELRLI